MAEEEQKNSLEDDNSEIPSDSDLFVASEGLDIQQELSEQQVFAGNEDFFKNLKDSVQAIDNQQIYDIKQAPKKLIALEHFSAIEKILIIGIIFIATVTLLGFLYTSLKSPTVPPQNFSLVQNYSKQPPSNTQQISSQKPATESTPQISTLQDQQPELTPTLPISLKIAEDYFLNAEYKKASSAYLKLLSNLSKNNEQHLRDFLKLKIALCAKKLGNIDESNHLFRIVAQSRSPIVRSIANYYQCLGQIQKKQYLKARTKAYQTIALFNAINSDSDWVSSLQRNCYFLVGEALTRKVLSLCDAENDIPKELWADNLEIYPFRDLNISQLQNLLDEGSKQLNKGSLGPGIQQIDSQDLSPHWSVVCNGASIEELMSRFAAKAGLNISWAFTSYTNNNETNRLIHPVRKRPLSLLLTDVTTQQFISIAAGSVGLLAYLDDNDVINIVDPEQYSALSENVSLLNRQGISRWQKFLFRFYNDTLTPNAHFAMGLLHAQNKKIPEAIAEYKLVANRFSNLLLAPYALLHSSKLKTNVHDFISARQDLKQLIELYPDSEITGQAYLYLADATMKIKLYENAQRLYRKVYHLNLSSRSQTNAAFSAGKCAYKIKDYQSATKWFSRYIKLIKDTSNNDLYTAYFLLGKTYLFLEKPQQACRAFANALIGQLPRNEYMLTVSGIVDGYIRQEQVIKALDLLEDINLEMLSSKERIEILLLKSKVLRTIGLVEKAIDMFGDISEYYSDPQLKTRISLELIECYIAKGDLELAGKKLAELLAFVEPGPLLHQVGLKLADISLKLGQNSQTILVCSQLLDLDISEQAKQKVLNNLATAYTRQKKYDKAILALLDQSK